MVNALLVYPEFPSTYWGMCCSLKFTGAKSLLPPLPSITVAAMLPPHWQLKLVDLNIESLDDKAIRWADVVMLTGMQVQRASIHEALDRCRRLGVPTVIGGPYATGEPHLLDSADYLVLGEAEDTIGDFCSALEAGRAPRITRNVEKPDITKAPVPRYDLLKRDAYFHMSIQYSRGCPFTCEFCDIIVIYGRKPRTKTNEQILAELAAIKETGFRGRVFFVDDNFIGNKKAVRTLLPEIQRWQDANGWPFNLYTEASLNLADDRKLMASMTSAGFDSVFIGIESPSPESLLETGKGQNVKGDIADRIHEIQRQGLNVQGGFIVGFDNDGPEIFDAQLDLIERAGIPFAMIGVLLALPLTPLEARMREAGRLKPDPSSGDPFGRTNFETVMPEHVLLGGYRRLLASLYEPRRYFGRVLAQMRRREKVPHKGGMLRPKIIRGLIVALIYQALLSPYRREYWRFLRQVYRWDRSRVPEALYNAAAGHHLIQYTRRVVLPRLDRTREELGAPLAATRPLSASTAERGS